MEGIKENVGKDSGVGHGVIPEGERGFDESLGEFP